MHEESDKEIDVENDRHNLAHSQQSNENRRLDWRNFILVLGKPGTGKSHAIKASIYAALQDNYRVVVATPTGILQSTYRSQLTQDQFQADTIHSLFKYPVNSERPRTNWSIGNFHLLVIDELSMVPERICRHISNTLQQLHVTPVVLLCGDEQQQQPIETSEGVTRQTRGILYTRQFYSSYKVFKFLQQHRCIDRTYQEYLDTLRYYKQNFRFLQNLEKDRVLLKDSELSDQSLIIVLKDFPEALILRVSRRTCNRVHRQNCGYSIR